MIPVPATIMQAAAVPADTGTAQYRDAGEPAHCREKIERDLNRAGPGQDIFHLFRRFMEISSMRPEVYDNRETSNPAGLVPRGLNS